MAGGYARHSNKAKCVIVDAIKMRNINLSTKLTCKHSHWMQDIPDQKQIVAQYCPYVGEIESGKNVRQMARRAFQFSTSDPKGPVHVTGPARR
jgi:thiamine pyrophosphate-dependent acetolactate synthase large subunit-like protein